MTKNTPRDNPPELKPLLFGAALLIACWILIILPYLTMALGKISKSQGWPKVPCEIVDTTAVFQGFSEEGNPGYDTRVIYKYTWEKREYTSQRIRFGMFANFSRSDRLSRAFPPGSQTVCYVNPQRPEEAVLRRENPTLYLLVIPAAISAILAFYLGHALYEALMFRPILSRRRL